MKFKIGVMALAVSAAGVSLAVRANDEPATEQSASRAGGDAASTAGERVYVRWCVECHGDGPRYPGTASLAFKYDGAVPAALEHRTDLTPAVVALFVRQGVSVMPGFRKTEISDAELAALGAYLSHQPEPEVQGEQ